MNGRKGTSSAPSLGILIGVWEWKATRAGTFMGRGSTTFEWTEDGAFVLQHADDQPSPDSAPEWTANSPMPVTAIIGCDDTTLEHTMLYSDARGVFRIYHMSLSHDSWRLWRAAPDFHQRFIGDLRDQGRTIEGGWESSPDGSAWETDFDMRYRKVEAPER